MIIDCVKSRGDVTCSGAGLQVHATNRWTAAAVKAAIDCRCLRSLEEKILGERAQISDFNSQNLDKYNHVKCKLAFNTRIHACRLASVRVNRRCARCSTKKTDWICWCRYCHSGYHASLKRTGISVHALCSQSIRLLFASL